ncbi:hypothetical protein C8024_17815 [Sphingopyxis sp. BSNA05]|nr:hypothetical protein [Sphingopyxis sp. BSNA05]
MRSRRTRQSGHAAAKLDAGPYRLWRTVRCACLSRGQPYRGRPAAAAVGANCLHRSAVRRTDRGNRNAPPWQKHGLCPVRNIRRQGTGPALQFHFAAPRPTEVRTSDIAEPDFPPLPGEADLHSGPPQFFTSNMEYVGKRIDTSTKTNRLTRWMRLKQRDGLDPVAEILCMCDSLPPSVMGLLDQNAMVSSMNWQVNVIAETLSTDNGWWLIDSHTHHADHGASSQYMSIWNSRRELMATAMQSVAYYA